MSGPGQGLEKQEVLEPDEVVHPRRPTASAAEAAAWPLREARFRITDLSERHPGEADSYARALGYIDLAERIVLDINDGMDSNPYG